MTAWYDKYATNATRNSNNKKFDISLSDLVKWANLFGDDKIKKAANSWKDTDNLSSIRSIWKDKNSGVTNVFNAFTNWVKNNQNPNNPISNGVEKPLDNINDKFSTTVGPDNSRSWIFNSGLENKNWQPDIVTNPINDRTKEHFSDIPAYKPIIPDYENYNRKQVRSLFRLNNINPYQDLSGLERRAYRKIASGEITDKNSNEYKIYSNLKTRFGEDHSDLFKWQNGGQMDTTQQDPKAQITALIQAAAQGDEQAQQTIQQIKQAAEQGDEQAIQMIQMIQQVMQELQGQQAQMARYGAKLNYIKQLKGDCPEGYEPQYFKVGGRICKQCVESAKCGKKMAKKAELGMEFSDNPVDKFKKEKKITPRKGKYVPKKKPVTTKRLDPLNTPKLPNGKYPTYWTPDERGQWERKYGANDEGAAVVENKGVGKNAKGGVVSNSFGDYAKHNPLNVGNTGHKETGKSSKLKTTKINKHTAFGGKPKLLKVSKNKFGGNIKLLNY